MPVENTGNNDERPEQARKPGRKPPGQFISDDLEEQTARFLEAVKGLAQRRKQRENEEGHGPPPRPGGPQRSSRR
jgi:hypothetical protein